mmetsp:Transcript_674/g.1667  ORF Transcript_674/g.1667 Transcript_674/m.1667 type:complete len:149 (-) Transcript_674:532-978(-)
MARVAQLESCYDSILYSNLLLLIRCTGRLMIVSAGIVRSAFVAVQILKSFVSSSVLAERHNDAILNSINTVSKQLNRDLAKFPTWTKKNFWRNIIIFDQGHMTFSLFDTTKALKTTLSSRLVISLQKEQSRFQQKREIQSNRPSSRSA